MVVKGFQSTKLTYCFGNGMNLKKNNQIPEEQRNYLANKILNIKKKQRLGVSKPLQQLIS